MERQRALALTEDVLERLVEGQGEWPLRLVREVYVFGSFARGALQPGDVDLNVEFDRDERWSAEFIEGLSNGYDPRRVFRQALVGRKRGVSFMFEGRDQSHLDLTLLWRRGDSLETALTRLHAIKEDPEAGRAERHAMLPQFEGMERWLRLSDREYFVEAIDKGALTVERLCLEVVDDVDHPLARQHLERRWSPNSPLHRAGRAVFAHLIGRGIDPAQVHPHGRDVRDRETPYFAGFERRYLRALPRCMTEFGGREWIEVVHPTRRGDLLALRVVPVSLASLKEIIRP
ncbi:nucleotidyltransferase domain-containing protein [Amorphoplanes digitatis]|uniref:Polymerase nucleotidyl transferase domain-containing protein n=1 Tax=Actinoplanes digitatis TaxID=1868 RepID=A0A7W7MNU5_9ACTN|nr:nucleotidyltransferase domain-containing protein [Actinoplanes digitatis]MBB4761423.1 hypothetical protein [Actinoplanes digitatis]GID94530.1 hypothetical protein Adi01nite_39420 [Actinoplanes digitatis]